MDHVTINASAVTVTSAKDVTDTGPPPVPPGRSPSLPLADGFYRPHTLVYRGVEHACDLMESEIAFLNAALAAAHVGVHEIMHPEHGLVFRERYVNAPEKRNKISQFLSRLARRLAEAQPPVPLRFSLPRGEEFVVRDRRAGQ